jgi:hypothetical protein
VVATAEKSLEGVPGLTADASSLIADLQAALGPEGQRLSQVLDGASTTLGSADEAMQLVLENRASIEASLRDLQITLANLKTFSDRVKQQPSSLLRSSPLRQRRPGDPARPGLRSSRSGAPAAASSEPLTTGGPQ